MSKRVRHPIFARIYARVADAAEAKGAAEHRAEMLAGLAGTAVEIGAGSGLNFAHYPSTVSQVFAVEPEAHLRKFAETAAQSASVAVTVIDGTAEAVPLPDASCDAAVCSLVLCSVPDQAAALAEIKRLLRPGGELRFYEHVIDASPKFARFQRRIDLVHPYVGGGCHVTRDTEAAMVAAGFEISQLRRFRFAPDRLSKAAAPKILGTARTPG